MSLKRIDFLGFSCRGSYKALFCTLSPTYGRICLTIAYRYRYLDVDGFELAVHSL